MKTSEVYRVQPPIILHRVLGMPGFQLFHSFVSGKHCAIWGSFATMSAYSEYFLDIAIAEFILQTSATREAYDTKVKDLGGKVIPVTVQSNCSYSVYAGPKFEFVLQYRFKSLMLKSIKNCDSGARNMWLPSPKYFIPWTSGRRWKRTPFHLRYESDTRY